MRARCSPCPYLWTAALFLLIAASDALFALPETVQSTAAAPTTACGTESSHQELQSASSRNSFAWFDLVCSLIQD